MSSHKKDPLEEAIEQALTRNGVLFERDDHRTGLDFYVPVFGIYIEVKRFHAARVADQMGRVDHVIAIQGVDAVNFFCALLDARNA